jgi:hypothetical protein
MNSVSYIFFVPVLGTSRGVLVKKTDESFRLKN